MYRYSDLRLEPFSEDYIQLKVDWINDPLNNRYLHYDLPLTVEKTLCWFDRIKNDPSRYDAVVMFEDKPVGLVGIIHIDRKNLKGEFYTIIGDHAYKHKGIGTRAGILCFLHGFYVLGLEKIYAYNEVDNLAGIRANLKGGFTIEGMLRRDLLYEGRKVDQFVLGLLKDSFVIPPQVFVQE